MGALARGVQPCDICRALSVNVDAAHQIVLAGVNRNRLFGHIVALFEHVFVNHREVVLDEIRVLIRNVKPEFVRAGFLLLLHNALRHNVARGKLLALGLVARHKALLVAVKQVSALAAHGFGYQEALALFSVGKGCRVKLNVAQILDFRAEVEGKLNSVTRGNRGVCGVVIHATYTACRENNIIRAVIFVLIIIGCNNVRKENSVLFLQTAEHGVVDNGNILELRYLPDKICFDFLACGVLVVSNSAARVTALQR